MVTAEVSRKQHMLLRDGHHMNAESDDLVERLPYRRSCMISAGWRRIR